MYDNETFNAIVNFTKDILEWKSPVPNDLIVFHEKSWIEDVKMSNNFNKYYLEYRKTYNTNLCTMWACWMATEALRQQWYFCQLIEKSARDLKEIDWFENISGSKITKQELLNAPAWSIFSVRYDHTSSVVKDQTERPSHTMVSMWNWIYRDLFWRNFREIDFKSLNIENWKFKINWSGYTITSESHLFKPNFDKLQKSQISDFSNTYSNSWKSLTKVIEELEQVTKLNKNYIWAKLLEQNPNLKFADIDPHKSNYKIKGTIQIKLPTAPLKTNQSETLVNFEQRGISSTVDFKLNAESDSETKEFFNWINKNKERILRLYPDISDNEFNRIAEVAIWILWKESKQWGLRTVAKNLKKSIKSENEFRDYSRWLTQLKLNINAPKDSYNYKKLVSLGVINEWSDIWQLKSIDKNHYIWKTFNEIYEDLKDNWYIYHEIRTNTLWISHPEEDYSNFEDKTKDMFSQKANSIDDVNNFISIYKSNKILNQWVNSNFDWNIITWNHIINTERILSDNENSAVATMVVLIWHYRNTIRNMLNDPDWSSFPRDKNGNPVNRDIVTQNNCFEYLYYCRNKQNEITNKTATPDRSIYIAEARSFNWDSIRVETNA